jgi:hypothetical protein
MVTDGTVDEKSSRERIGLGSRDTGTAFRGNGAGSKDLRETGPFPGDLEEVRLKQDGSQRNVA